MNLIRFVSMLLVAALLGCAPAGLKKLVTGSGDGVIEVRVDADAKGKLTDIKLNGKSVGRDPAALRPDVVPLVVLANEAKRVPKARILVGADVRHADFLEVVAALTNDVVDGQKRYTLVKEWELKVDGSPMVLNGAAGNLKPNDRFDEMDEEIQIRD